MHEFDVEAAPRLYARIAGVLYLFIIVTGIVGEVFVRNAFVVTADPASTASRIMADPSLWRLGIAVVLLEHLLDIPVALILYLLMRPVSRSLALLALAFTLVSTAVLIACKLALLVPVFLLGNAPYLKALDPHVLQALAYVAIRADAYGFGIGLIDFGAFCLTIGYLIYRSGFLPRMIGLLMAIAGLCYLTNSFAVIAAPAFADAIYPLILLPAFIAELSFCLWLIVKGVDAERWRVRHAA